MQIIAKANLLLNRQRNTLTIYYDTYALSTFDQYLMASLAKNAVTKDEAYTYIDELTGKGSLNQHFKDLYDKTASLESDQIEKILSDSLYPITKIENDSYYYYPQLNVSLYRGNSYEGNLREKEEIIVSKLLPKEADGKYRDFRIGNGEEKESKEAHDLIFDDSGIYIDFGDKNKHFVNPSLSKIINPNQLDEQTFLSKGIAISSIDEKARDYKLLDKATFLALLKEGEKGFKDNDGHWLRIDQEYFVRLDIVKVFDTYFYREARLEFSKENKSICNSAIEYLIDSGDINVCKTKTLVPILENADDLIAQKAVNYILTRKNSKEISEVGFHIMNRGVYKGWERETLFTIRRTLDPIAMMAVYKCDPTLGYSIEQLIAVTDRTCLTEEDAEKVKVYFENRENKIKLINAMIGEITTSGVRERMKSLAQKDDVYRSVKEFLNKQQGHVHEDINELNDAQLEHRYNEVKSMYEGNFQKIKDRLEKEDQ